MNMSGFIESVRSATEVAFQNVQESSPEILAGLGVVGFIAAVVCTAKAVHEADKDIEEKKEELEVEELPAKEVVKTTWKRFIVPTVLVIFSILCIFFSCRESHRKVMEMTAAYSLTQQRLQDYAEATKETVGKKKEAEIRSAAAQKAVNRTDLSESVIDTGTGHALWFIPESREYLRASSTYINNVEASIQKLLYQRAQFDEYVDGDDVRNALGLNRLGNDVGLLQRFYPSDGEFKFQRDYCSAPDGSPCCMIYVEWKQHDMRGC